MVRKILLILVLALLAAAGGLYWVMRPLPILTVTSWAGPYGRAQASAQMRPYAAANRVDVHLAEWEGDLTGLKGDVVDFELPKAVEACAQGLLEKLDVTALPDADDGTKGAEDFVPGALGPCWVGSIVYSQVILYAPGTGPAPAGLSDVFDTARFPGKRALKRTSAKYNLELALLADGVAPRDVYPLLSTDAGMTRALHKLDSLKPDLVWYDRDSQALALIQNGQAAFATALNGQVFDAVQHGAVLGHTLGVIWDRQLYEFDAFGIRAGDPKKAMALDYIRFATGAKPLAGVAGWVPYGPARRSAWSLVGRNPETGADMTPFLPTSHFETAFAVNDSWWRDNGRRVDTIWQNWLADLTP